MVPCSMLYVQRLHQVRVVIHRTNKI
jgi:hypothetical protein